MSTISSRYTLQRWTPQPKIETAIASHLLRALLAILVGLAIWLLLLPGRVSAQSAPADSWRGEYFNNSSLSGLPVFVRNESSLNFNWGGGSPAPGVVTEDRFSARFSRTFFLDPATYRFSVTADDGVRMFVNGALVVDQWHDQVATSYSADFAVTGGAATVVIEYYENIDQSVIGFSFARVTDSGGGSGAGRNPIAQNSANWRGEYFNNVMFSGSPALVRSDPRIDFNWGTGSPAPGVIGSDRFSVRWTASINLSAGRYRFSTAADDGVRVWVNGALVIDRFAVQSVQVFNTDVNISGGPATVVMEYFENTEKAEARLWWANLDAPQQPPLSPPPSVTGQTGIVVGANALNVRTGPGLFFTPYTTLARGQTVEMIGRNANATWIEIVRPDGIGVGWVSSFYLYSTQPLSALPITY
jgi:hypothetical protein